MTAFFSLAPNPPVPFGVQLALASTKLSQITNGNLVSAATDQVVTVRSGTTDVLASVGSLAGENLTAVIPDNGSGGATIGSGQVTNGMLANSSMTLAGHAVSLGGTQAFACGDLSNGATGCSTTVGTAATQNTGTSGATLPFLNGNNVWSGTNAWTGGLPSLSNGTGAMTGILASGAVLAGQGSTNDIEVQNKSGSDICKVATGTTNFNCTALQVGGTNVLTGNQTLTLSSDATGSGTTAISVTLPANVVTNSKASQAGANTMKGNWTAGTANEADNAMPSCSDSGGNHLNYVSGTGVTCGTSDLHAGTVTSVATTAPLAGGTINTTGTLSITGAAGQVLAGSAPAFTATPTLGVNGTTAGTLALASSGASGASITLQNLGATSAYNFNLPSTAGSAGQVLTAQGGGSNSMTWASDNVGGGMFNYSDNGVTVTANTYFSPIGGGGIPQTTEASVDVPSPSATTVTNLQVGISVAIGAGNTITITLRDASSDTSLTCQIAGASATTCSDLTHSVNVSQNDLIDWKIVTTGTIIVTPTITISANNGTSNVGVTSVSTNNGLTGGTITTTGTLGLALISTNKALCNNSGSDAVPTAANCTITGTTSLALSSGATETNLTLQSNKASTALYLSSGAAEVGLFSAGNTNAATALNLDNGNMQVLGLTSAVTLTLTSPANPTKSAIIIKQDGTGHVYSLSSCKWAGGTAITYSSAAGKIDEISIMYDGTNFYCMGGAAFQ